MTWFQSELKDRNLLMFKRYPIQAQNPPPEPPLPSNAETSPAMLFIIVILAIIFFISGLLHLLARFIMRHRPSSSDFPSNQNIDISDSRNFQRQLHQLFNTHDSGLDQEVIDALPLFQYKDISGLKDPFDCAVCLCEFSEHDKLRLLPICSHAFHVDCIDTWLLSNSTCPLCRGAIYTPGLNTTNPNFGLKDWRGEDGLLGLSLGGCDSPNEVETVVEKRRVFPVILGKFTSSVNEEQGENISEFGSSNLDVRRCFSMGSCQYIVADSELQVALSSNRAEEDGDLRILRVRARNNDKASVEGDVNGKKISAVSKNESLSVSKIWLWSNKDRNCGSSNMRLPWNSIA